MKVRNYHGSSCVWFIVNVIPDVKSSLRRLKLVWTWQKKTFFPQGLQCQLLQTADMWDFNVYVVTTVRVWLGFSTKTIWLRHFFMQLAHIRLHDSEYYAAERWYIILFWKLGNFFWTIAPHFARDRQKKILTHDIGWPICLQMDIHIFHVIHHVRSV